MNKAKTKQIMNKKQPPTIETKRLILRPWTLDDAPEIQRFLSDRDIASNIANIPYPIEDGYAEQWVRRRIERVEKGEVVSFAITHGQEGYFIGAIGFNINKEHNWADIGFWIGKPYWNHGYCTESAQALLEYGFDVLKLNRIWGQHMTRNPASGKVMQKIGMKYEGCLRQHYKKWGTLEDLDCYGILRSEYNK